VQHGVGETRDECTVAIEAARENDRLVLRVTDTGPGFDTTDLEAVLDEGAGLANVWERLDLFFGTSAEMQLRPQGVELRVPVRPEAGERPRPAPETIA
jgi:sensor histidine kinase YesM